MGAEAVVAQGNGSGLLAKQRILHVWKLRIQTHGQQRHLPILRSHRLQLPSDGQKVCTRFWVLELHSSDHSEKPLGAFSALIRRSRIAGLPAGPSPVSTELEFMS